MESCTSHGETRREEGLSSSCWGHLKLMLPWTRRKRGHKMVDNSVGCSNCFITKRQRHLAGTFRYSPLSYAQNFDEWVEENVDSSLVGFSSRYAAPSSTAHSQGNPTSRIHTAKKSQSSSPGIYNKKEGNCCS